MKITIFTAGGTIDKIYFDAKSEYLIGESKVGDILIESKVETEYDTYSILRKDSLEMTDSDRQLIYDTVASASNSRILLTHGTDTMVQTACKLLSIKDKTIVMTGSMAPARFKETDAIFNIGFAFAAAQTLFPGTYIAMNGKIFDPQKVKKNRAQNRFDEI